MNGNTATYGELPIFGTLTVNGTQVVAIDNTSGRTATVSLSGSDWCSADLSRLTPSRVIATHNADGSKTVDISLTGGYTASTTRFSAVYTWTRQSGTTPGGHPIYTQESTPIGIETPAYGTMALTTHTPTYTVSYKKGSYGTGTNTTDTKTYNVPLTLKGAIFTRTGYTQDGWSLNSNGSTKDFNLSASYTANAATTLYPHWKANTYTLTLTKGNYISSVSGGGSKTFDTSVTATATLSTATGYTTTFDGWYEGATKKSSSQSYTFNMPAGDLSLTAKGNRTAHTYSVKFNAKGGSGTMANESFTYGVSKALTANAFTKTGYTFKGWDTSSAGSTVVYTNGQSVSNLTATNGGTVNLYAVWQPLPYTLSTDPGLYATITVKRNGVTLSNGATIYYDDVLTVTYAANPGYHATTHTINGSTFTSGDTHTVTGDVSVVVRCLANEYTLAISAGTGSSIAVNCTSSPSGQGATGAKSNGAKIYTGDKLSITFTASTGYSIATHTVNGSEFTSGGSYTVAGAVSVVSTATKKTYKLTIASGTKSSAVVSRTESPIGGAFLGNLETNATLYHNDKLKITFSSQAGYHLRTHTVNGSTFTSGNSHTVTAAVSVAAYSDSNTYTVKFNANRGTASGSGTMADQSFTYGVSQKVTANAFTRYFRVTFNGNGGSVSPSYLDAESSFIGWARSASGTAEISDGASVYNLTTTNNGTVNLYAKWSNSSITLPSPNNRTGYTFKGWYTAASGGTKIGDAGASYKPTADVTLYAQWTKLSYTLSIEKSPTGVTLEVRRTSSPIGGGALAVLSNGAKLYSNDVLEVTYSIAAGYEKQTATVNGAEFASGATFTVSGNVSVVVTTKNSAVEYIYEGNGWGKYQACIYEGDGVWGLYQAYIYDGTRWVAY